MITRNKVLMVMLPVLVACGRPPLNVDIPAKDKAIVCTNDTRNIPADPGVRGPWTVGARTVAVPNERWGALKTEIWYPALAGSDGERPAKTYDLRQFLPAKDAAKIPADVDTLQTCDCVDGLPVDAAAGPFPVVVFIHGTASFRTQSSVQATHWASRGFVVISVDHPKIQLRDLKANPLGSLAANQAQDAVDVITALQSPVGDLAFLNGVIDTSRVAVSGHSAGAMAAGALGSVPGVRVLIPMSGGGAAAGEYLISTLVMGAVDDKVVAYSRQTKGFDSTLGLTRLVGIDNAGHMAFTEICALLKDQGGIIQVAEDYGVNVPSLLKTLGRDGCDVDQLSPETGWALINYATSAVLEETLQCKPEAALAFDAVASRFPAAVDVTTRP